MGSSLSPVFEWRKPRQENKRITPPWTVESSLLMFLARMKGRHAKYQSDINFKQQYLEIWTLEDWVAQTTGQKSVTKRHTQWKFRHIAPLGVAFGHRFLSCGLSNCRSSQKENENRCLVFTSAIKREIRKVHVVIVQWRQSNVQKKVMHLQSCSFVNLILLLFCRLLCRRRRLCL